MKKHHELSRNLPFMCLLSFSVGIIAGLGAWAFRMLIGLVHNILFLGKFHFFMMPMFTRPEIRGGPVSFWCLLSEHWSLRGW